MPTPTGTSSPLRKANPLSTETIYLLTGASGLLGTNILELLLARKARVRALVRDPARKHLPEGIEVVDGDLRDARALDRFFAVPRDTEVIVIHAAAVVTLNPYPDAAVRAVNVGGTAAIVNRCVSHHVRKLVYVSSTGAIPEPPSGPITEVEFHDPSRVVGFYSQTKGEASNLVLQAVRERGLNASIVYPSGIFGPGDRNYGLITSAIRFFASGRLPVSIGGSFNSVDVRDLAEGILAAAESSESGTYIMAGECHTFTELLNAICDEAGVRRPWFTVPLGVLRPLAWIGGRLSRLTNRPLLFTDYTLYNLERNNDFSSRKAATELGFRTRPLRETIRDTIEWLRES